MAVIGEAAYDLEGSLLEACDCNVLCPCWIGEDPDGGTCQAVVAYHFDRGTIRGVDVGGLSLVLATLIPGNIFAGGWTQVLFIDDAASEPQAEAILDAFTGELGGPLADLAQLVGQVLDVKRAPIVHEIMEGKGILRVGDGTVSAAMEPYRGPDGTETTLHNSVFSTVPGSPAYVGKTSSYAVDIPEHGMTWTFEGRNAIQADWKLVHPADA
jgi:hypothetical protein